MSCKVEFSNEECTLMLEALQFLQDINLEKTLVAAKNLKYETVKFLYNDKALFQEDKQNRIKIISKKIEDIENIYKKIENEM